MDELLYFVGLIDPSIVLFITEKEQYCIVQTLANIGILADEYR
jgi:hypothetical protein